MWGVVTACTTAVTNYHGLLACRIMIGILEAATPPCLMLITSNSSVCGTRNPRLSGALLFGTADGTGIGIAQILGSLVSWGKASPLDSFQQVTHEAFLGWRVMFLVLGCVTAVAGVWASCPCPTRPWTHRGSRKWRTCSHSPDRSESNRHQNMHVKWQPLCALFMNPQIWLLTAMTILSSMSSGAVAFYSTTLIRNFGFSPLRGALLNMPSGAASFLACLTSAYFAHKSDHRALVAVGCSLLAAMGSGLMSFLPPSNRAGLLAGVYLCPTGGDHSGQTKRYLTLLAYYRLIICTVHRVTANALITAALAVGDILGPQLFKAKDAPQYIPATIVLLVTQIAVALVRVGLRIYYGWQKRREMLQRRRGIGEAENRKKSRTLSG
ncbi:major facilitator superfamily domain-containing protein [Mycena latifolia]|nr:major facilitator superfamily domain-containing protein [Mycena latifolia]